MITQLETAQNAYQFAREAAQAGNTGRATNLFANAAISFLSLAVTGYDDIEAAKKFLIAEHVPDQLATGAAAAETALADVHAKKAAASSLTGPYIFLALSHLAALLGEHEPCKIFSRVGTAPELLGGPFWAIYASSYMKFLASTPFETPVPKSLRGGEKYWFQYVEYMALVSRREPADEKLAELRSLLAKRNADKRVANDDSHRIDGSVNQPVKWDFRLEGLLRAQRA